MTKENNQEKKGKNKVYPTLPIWGEKKRVELSQKEIEEIAKVHQWMNRHYGTPKTCEGLDCRKRPSRWFDWALKKGCRYERSRDSFLRLCRSCHRRYDLTPEKKDQATKNLSMYSPKYGTKRKWEKEFERQFGHHGPIWNGMRGTEQELEVREFISRLLESQRTGVTLPWPIKSKTRRFRNVVTKKVQK